MELCEKLRKYRDEKKLTQKEVADLIGVEVSTYAHYEKGDRTPKPETYNKLLQLFPIECTMIFPSEQLDALEKAIKEIKCISDDHLTARQQFQTIRALLTPILDCRNKYLTCPDIPLNDLSALDFIDTKTLTIKKVNLDMRAERLISLALKLQNNYFEKFT